MKFGKVILHLFIKKNVSISVINVYVYLFLFFVKI